MKSNTIRFLDLNHRSFAICLEWNFKNNCTESTIAWECRISSPDKSGIEPGKFFCLAEDEAAKGIYFTSDGKFFGPDLSCLINLYIEICGIQRIVFDKLPPWFHLISHQGGENFIGRNGIFNLHLQQASGLGIESGFPELIGVHLT